MTAGIPAYSSGTVTNMSTELETSERNAFSLTWPLRLLVHRFNERFLGLLVRASDGAIHHEYLTGTAVVTVTDSTSKLRDPYHQGRLAMLVGFAPVFTGLISLAIIESVNAAVDPVDLSPLWVGFLAAFVAVGAFTAIALDMSLDVDLGIHKEWDDSEVDG